MSRSSSVDGSTKSNSHAGSVVSRRASNQSRASSHHSHGSAKSNSCASSAGSAGSRGSGEDEDEEMEEPFETYKLKVIQLCHDIGWGEPSQTEHIEGGGYNRIVGLTFLTRQPQQYIIRIPRDGKNFDKSQEIKDQVTVIHFVSQHLKVPAVTAYDSTTNNALSSAYVFYERALGTDLDKIYDSLPFHEKLQIAERVARLMIEMESIQLESPGLLGGSENLPSISHERLSSSNDLEIRGFRSARYGTAEPLPKLEGSGIIELLQKLFGIREKNFEQSQPWMMEKMEKLHKIAGQMADLGLVRKSDTDCVLWHWDFAARNIMVTAPSKILTATPSKEIKKTGCRHNIQITTGCSSGSNRGFFMEITRGFKWFASFFVGTTLDDPRGTKYTFKVAIENASAKTCKHHATFKHKDASGTTYNHTVDVEIETPSDELTAILNAHEIGEIEQYLAGNSPSEGLEITGLLDWDGVLSVPLVLARAPPIWLWTNLENRSSDWSGNLDDPPARQLTPQELLIKGKFDSIMENHSPGYMTDAYYRGPWLRRLARFALFGFSEFGCNERYETFVKEWKEYYEQCCGPQEDTKMEDSCLEEEVDINHKDDEDVESDYSGLGSVAEEDVNVTGEGEDSEAEKENLRYPRQ